MADVALVFITPQLAEEWLRQPGRWQLDGDRVKVIADSIVDGSYRLGGQPIIRDARGQVIDGHHRLAAVVAANVGVPSLVVSDVSPN